MKKWLALLLVILASCSPKTVSYVNTKARFGDYETYRIVTAKAESENLDASNNQVLDMIKANIREQMKLRDYVESNIDPDLVLRYEITSSTRTETRSSSTYLYTPRLDIRTIHESILLLELLNRNNKLVWQGSYDLKQEKKEQKTSRAIKNGIGYIFTTYPYRAKTRQPDEALTTFEKVKKSSKK